MNMNFSKNIHKLLLNFLLGGIFLLNICNAQAAIIYVDASALGSNNGSSWVNAYTNLQSALSTALNGDEIWVANGVYIPSVALDIDGLNGAEIREKTFQIPPGVAMYGGFAGGEDSLSDRNPELNLTILSGDLDGNDINLDANHIAEVATDIVGNNAYHVVYTPNANLSTRMDGFVVTAGKANKNSIPASRNYNRDGGGLLIAAKSASYTSSPTIYNCTFQGNFAVSGGAALAASEDTTGNNFQIQPVITLCKFIQNESDNEGGAIFIGSFRVGQYEPTILKCAFTDNEALRSGGAIYLIGGTTHLDSCTFTGNEVTVISDGGTLPGSGGGIFALNSDIELNACMFFNNSATGNPTGVMEGGGGGAVHWYANESSTSELGASSIRLSNCGFFGNSTGGNGGAWGGAALNRADGGILEVNYINCVFSGNTAQNEGGASASYSRNLGSPAFTPQITTNFTNCTFANNSAGVRGGGVVYDEVFNAANIGRIENSIFWDNTAPASAEVYNSDAILTIASSLIEGSGGSGGGWAVALGTDGGNNLDENPDFVNAANALGADNIPATVDDGLKLQGVSPAINAGNNVAVGLVGVTEEITGSLRIQDGQVDMGAYENVPAPEDTTTTTIVFCPTQDAYLSGFIRFNTNLIRVDQNSRTGFLKFDLSGVSGEIVSAQLLMTVNSDAGSGQIRIYEGSNTAWTENNLNIFNRPAQGAILGSLSGGFLLNKTYTWDLKVNELNGGGPLSLIVRHAGRDDVAFASEENLFAPAPRLVLKVKGKQPVCRKIFIPKFDLVDALNDEVIRELKQRDVIDLRLNPRYNIIARARGCNCDQVKSVVFYLNGKLFKVENTEPYAMGGDRIGNFSSLNLPLGIQTIKAIPYPLANGKGEPGEALEILVNVTRGTTTANKVAQDQPSLDQDAIQLGVYPNPGSDVIHVKVAHPDNGQVIIQMTDLLGRVVAYQVLDKTQTEVESTLQVKEIPEGAYLLKVQHGNFQKIEQVLINHE
ncbi:MAG: T9SS type A sorting domain-containing protein [Microscillaceae bacterium]|nr:T9SS type A sorting domain-containing protein [Microscillaceae bacterium]